MKGVVLLLLTVAITTTSFCQSELKRMVPFDIPIGTSEENAKSIISGHRDISMRSSKTENGVKTIEYRDTWIDAHVLYLSIENGYVTSVEWGYQYSYYEKSTYLKYKAISTYLEEYYGSPKFINENGSGVAFSSNNYIRYYPYYKDKNYGAILQYYDAKSNSTLLSLFMLAFSETDGGCAVSIRFCSTAKVQQAINRIKQKEKEEQEKIKSDEFNSRISSAREYARNGEYTEALQKYQEALVLYPKKSNEYEAEIEKCKQDRDSAIERKKQNQFNYLIASARSKYSLKDYTGALAEYNSALALYPEKRKDYTPEIDKCRCREYCKLGDTELERHQYSKSREYYNNALKFNTELKNDIENKLSYVDEVEKFDNERKNISYNYQTIDAYNYAYATNRLEELILEYAKQHDIQPCTVTVSYQHTISGHESKEITVSPQNNPLKTYLTTKAPSLPVCERFGLKLATTATIQIPVQSVTTKNITAKRTTQYGLKANETLSIDQSQTTKPGSYKIGLTTICINGKENNFQKLLSYENTGGPNNVLLSMLIPGAGQRNVTYGKKSGIRTTLSVYGLIAGGVCFFLYSDKEYENYHKATTQSDMDKHFETAQGARIIAYSCLGGAAVVWINDIIDVFRQGKENIKKHGDSWTYVSYFPQNNGFGIGYTLNL